jgi:hypothetical protein
LASASDRWSVIAAYRCIGVGLDLDSYRRGAERFREQLDREYYLHLAGHKRELEIAPIYERHRDLFSREAVEALREAADAVADDRGADEARRRRYLLDFAVHGHLGLATHEHSARLAELEASLELELDSERIPYRGAPIVQANEPGAERREQIADARDALLIEHLNPLHLEVLERSHALARELGWRSYREMCEELSGIDLGRLAKQTRAFLAATEDLYDDRIDPELGAQELPPLGKLRRSDLPRFFRAAPHDRFFPQERMLPAFVDTLAGLGIDLDAQPNIHLDTESRPTKTPRAFCSVPRVPDEVYLVVAPTGGKDDYQALFHEGGHAEHYGNTDPELPFEFRHLGDNSVTESFAFLFDGLVSEPRWLESPLGIEDPAPLASHSRAVRLVFLRRYAAKLDYELELHEKPELAGMPSRYAELLSAATAVEWPEASWLADVDEGFYAALYMRAWALEATWRAALAERFGDRWFESCEAGAWLRDLWRWGQRLDADDLVAETLGGSFDVAALANEL